MACGLVATEAPRPLPEVLVVERRARDRGRDGRVASAAVVGEQLLGDGGQPGDVVPSEAGEEALVEVGQMALLGLAEGLESRITTRSSARTRAARALGVAGAVLAAVGVWTVADSRSRHRRHHRHRPRTNPQVPQHRPQRPLRRRHRRRPAALASARRPRPRRRRSARRPHPHPPPAHHLLGAGKRSGRRAPFPAGPLKPRFAPSAPCQPSPASATVTARPRPRLRPGPAQALLVPAAGRISRRPARRPGAVTRQDA